MQYSQQEVQMDWMRGVKKERDGGRRRNLEPEALEGWGCLQLGREG